MARTEVLPKKYLDALSLIEEGILNYREIAKKCSITEKTFYDLVEGKYPDSDAIQQLFSEKLNEINKRLDQEIRKLVKSNKKETQELIQTWLSKYRNKTVDTKLMSTIVSVANALAKSTPNVEIGSFSYTKGLSPEDIYAEFRRLSGLASDRGAVQAPETGRTGEISLHPGSRGAASEVEEDPIL